MDVTVFGEAVDDDEVTIVTLADLTSLVKGRGLSMVMLKVRTECHEHEVRQNKVSMKIVNLVAGLSVVVPTFRTSRWLPYWPLAHEGPLALTLIGNKFGQCIDASTAMYLL